MSLRAGLVVAALLSSVVCLPQMSAQPPAAAPARATATATSPVAGATIHGLVTDPDDALVPAATVTLTSSSGKAQTATSASDGTYSFRGVQPGTYVLTVTAPGFAAFLKEAIRVTAGANVALDTKLSIQTETQQMTVTANPTQLSVDPESNASATVINGAALDALSDDPDELSSELTALAGPSAGPNGGQVYIDGFTGGQLPPKSSIREIRINQNPFSAQFDQLGYGRVEVFTKPGTDQLHGSANLQFGDKVLNTSDPFLGAANSQPAYHKLFFFGSLTGPVRTGMSFTLSGSYRDIQNNAIINPTAIYSSSPTSTTICQPGDLTCSANPYPTSARAVTAPQTRWDISPRIDLAIGSKNTLTTRYQYESNTQTSNGGGNSLPTLGYTASNYEQEIQISDTQLISTKIINETRFEYQRSGSNQNPFDTGPSISVQGIFSAGGSGGGSVNSTTGDHIEVQNYTSVQLAKNFIRLGGRLRTSGESISSNAGENGSFQYSYLLDPCTDPTITNKPSNCVSGATVPCAAANTTPTTPGVTPTVEGVSSYQCGILYQFNQTAIHNLTISARETDVGLYAEDDWKARPNLTISYGLRLETENYINSSHDFAPRTSIAYGIPRKNGKTTTVLRGGFGIFYNRYGLNSIANDIQNNGTNQTDSVYFNPPLGCSPTSLAANASTCTTGSVTPTKSVIYVADPSLRSAYTIQSAATIEQQVGKYANVSATYLNARGEHQFLVRDIPSGTSSLVFHNQSGGVFRQNQINTSINVHTPQGIAVFGFYAATWANSNLSGITNPYNSRTDYGRAGFAIRNRLTIGGTFPLPFHLTASPIIFAQSGTPFNVTTGVDENLDSLINDRPAFLPGATSASCTNAHSFFTPAQSPTYVAGESYQQIPVNYCTGPANVSFNLRLSRTFGFGPLTEAALAAKARNAAGGGPGGPGGFGGGPGGPRGGGRGGPGMGGGGSNTGHKYNLTVGAQASNLFNQVPYAVPVSQLTSALFGRPIGLAGGPYNQATAVRQIMLQANFSF